MASSPMSWLSQNALLVSSLTVATIVVLQNVFGRLNKKRRLRVLKEKLEDEEKLVRSELKEKIEKEKQEKQQLWNDIVNMEFQNLMDALAKGDLSSLDVLRAFQSRAMDADEKLNCVTHFISDAESLALDLDALPSSDRGPLHGLPISVKECFKLNQCYSTAGYTLNLSLGKNEKDCPLISQLKNMGCIPFCQTNLPISMCTLQCSNPLFGGTGNPWDEKRDCGGSSGGEGALLGAGGSVVGIGTDIGGSLRNPAAYCGCFSIKPTYGRHLSVIGVESGTGNVDALGMDVVGGFMSSQLEGLIDVYRRYWNANKSSIDPSIHPSLRFDSELYENEKRLKIGYFTSYGIFEHHKGCVRVVEETVKKLEELGHTVIEIEPPSMIDVAQMYIGLFFADGRKELAEKINNEFGDSATFDLMLFQRLFNLPKFLQWPLLRLQRLLCKFHVDGVFDTPSKLLEAKFRSQRMREMYFDYMNKMEVDAIITPAALFPAPLKGSLGSLSLATFPYIGWNVLNFPAGIVPCSLVTKEDDDHFKENFDKDLLLMKAPKAVSGSVGLPLAVQVVARPFQEEQLFRVMKDIDNCFEFKKNYNRK